MISFDQSICTRNQLPDGSMLHAVGPQPRLTLCYSNWCWSDMPGLMPPTGRNTEKTVPVAPSFVLDRTLKLP